jgi:hypothetical protein
MEGKKDSPASDIKEERSKEGTGAVLLVPF